MKYTVVLQRPDYCTGCYGLDTYTAYVNAPNVKEAVFKARNQARDSDMLDDNVPLVKDLEDYAVLVAFEGHPKMVFHSGL